MKSNETEKTTKSTITVPFVTNIILLFLNPFIFNKAIAAFVAVGYNLPIFTYWQMFFIAWGVSRICRIIGNIFHK